ncbi:hypothetical protein F4824DRAFT_337583 [Ustulina deusta]|nr:hypothetical protein F4824DRAFT_337583 [Ustulina deusta]
MDIAGLALSAFGAAQQLADIGLRIYRRIKDEKKINAMLHELKLFEVEDQKQQLSIHVELAQAVLRSPLVSNEHKERLKRLWKEVTAVLAKIDALIDQMIINSSLLNTIARHQARDQLNSLASRRAVSGALSSFRDCTMALRELMKEDTPLFLSSNDFTPIDLENKIILRPDAFLCRGRITRPRSGFSTKIQWFLYESKVYPSESKEESRENIRILSEKLDRAGAMPDGGIFKFVGFRHSVEGHHGAFQLIFSSKFDGRALPTLQSYITHTLGLVHKNIRPENIAIIRDTAPVQVGGFQGLPATAYLTGWQYARQVEHGVTNFSNDITVEKRIYQHPDRQLPTAEKEYSMAHDVYSLGVCMLEILAWESILVMNDPPTVSEAFVAAFNTLGFQLDQASPTGPHTKFPGQIKATLIKMNESETPRAAGSRVSRLIDSFLTCLDEAESEGEADGDAVDAVVLNDKDTRRVAMHFVDTALEDLRNLVCVI